MGEHGTVILTSRQPALLAALQNGEPGLQTLIAEQGPPRERIEGRVWCFVDWLLPDVSGLEMCRRLRDAPVGSHSHITMVLDEDDIEARRRALRAGADDYLIGPLTADVLLERLRQQRQALPSAHGPRLTHGELTLDMAGHQVRWRGKLVPLRANEFRLLAGFVEHPDQVLSRAALIALLGKDDQSIDERTVDVWVGRLRRNLKSHGAPDLIRTVRAFGYVLDSV